MNSDSFRKQISPQRIGAVYVLAAMIIAFSLLSDDFFSVRTFQTMANEQAITGLVAVGLTIALATGAFDLSIGACMSLIGVTCAQLISKFGMHWTMAVIISIGLATAVGLLNGVIVTRAKVDAIITTLGVGSVLTALTYLVSGNRNIIGLGTSFKGFAATQVFTLTLPVFYLLGTALVLGFLLVRTPFGRRLYATGANAEVARLAGVNTGRYLFIAFTISSMLAGLGGIIVASRLGTGSPSSGPGYLLPAFAACFLGATQVRPGRFNVWGTIIAVFLLAVGVKGLVLVGASFWAADLFNGVALVVAVAITRVRKKKSSK